MNCYKEGGGLLSDLRSLVTENLRWDVCGGTLERSISICSCYRLVLWEWQWNSVSGVNNFFRVGKLGGPKV